MKQYCVFWKFHCCFCTHVATELNCFWLKLPSVLAIMTEKCCLQNRHVFQTVWAHTSQILFVVAEKYMAHHLIHLKYTLYSFRQFQSLCTYTPVTVDLHGKQLAYLDCGTVQILCVTEFLNCGGCQNLDDAVNNVN